MNVTWSGAHINSGSGTVHLWSKSKLNQSGSTATTEGMPCGSTLPEVTTKSYAGGLKVSVEVPNAAWDSAQMPKFTGTATKVGSSLTVDPGISLVGLTMTDPTAAWPAASAITSVNHDGDAKPGITAIPKDATGYSLPPTSISQSSRVDEVYLATRTVMTLNATVDGCPQTYSGTASVTKFESHVIGCHVKGGGECTTTEANFVDDNRTIYTVGSATFTTKVVSDTATCADVRAALP